MGSLIDQLAALEQQARHEMGSVNDPQQVQAAKVKFLGRKGLLTGILKQMGGLSATERPEVGRRANALKVFLEAELQRLETHFVSDQLTQQLATTIDVTLPGRSVEPGHAHPIRTMLDEIVAIFSGFGFSIYEGPEVETDYYNFEALNMPPNHPARDMQDTFYVGKGVVSRQSSVIGNREVADDRRPTTDDALLLRTHTSPVQIRVMERMSPPIRMIAPGAVYRRDADVTHSPMFHQVEGLCVDRGITMGDLKGVITTFVHRLFGDDIPLRLRPSFFPFTEPSAEVDIGCFRCRQQRRGRNMPANASCRVCKGTGWLEILGAGMVDPEVFRHVKYDSRKVSGFAFGLGVERVAMLKYGIDDIRLLYSGDMRFLEQF